MGRKLKPVRRQTILLIPLLLFSGWQHLLAAVNHDELVRTRGARSTLWSFDATLTEHRFINPDGSKLGGLAGALSFGYGRVLGNSWILGRFNILSGPWGAARNGAFDSDFSGSAVDLEYGTSFPGTALRSGSGPFLSLALGYMDLSGKNIGGNKKPSDSGNPDSDELLEQSFKSNFGAVYLLPAVGWGWTKSARPLGNEPEFLITRVESTYLKLGINLPIYSRSRVQVIRRPTSDQISQTPVKESSSGTIRGYSIIISTGLWLGV